MSRAMLIGLTGFAGSGKTTCAQLLEREHGFARLKFTTPLRAMLAAAGLTQAQLDGDQKHQPLAGWCNRTPRYIMQTLGTEWGRKLIGEDLWVNLLVEKAEALLHSGQSVVVDDVRFLNEARALRQLGGSIYRVLRIHSPLATGCASDHPSEQEQLSIPVDGYIRNDAGYEELRQQLEQLTRRCYGTRSNRTAKARSAQR